MKSKHYMLALIPLSAAGLLLRVLQVLNGIEPDTLFFVEDAAVNFIFHLFLVLCLLFFLSGLFVLKNEKKPLDRAVMRARKPERIVLLVFATLTLTAELYGFYKDIVGQTSSLSVWRSLCALSAMTFLSAYAAAPKTLCKNGIVKVLSLSLTLYYCVRLLDVFINMSMIQLSYKGPMILLCASAALFFLSFSKALAGMTARKTLVVFGCCTVFLGAVNFGNFVAFLVSSEHTIQQSWLALAADTALIAVSVFFMKKPFPSKQTQESADKEIADK